MAAARKNIVLAAYRRRVAQKSGAGLAAEANEAARREAMRNHPSSYRTRDSRPALPSASVTTKAGPTPACCMPRTTGKVNALVSLDSDLA